MNHVRLPSHGAVRARSLTPRPAFDQYDSDEDDLAVFSPGTRPADPSAPSASSAAAQARPAAQQHFASNADPFANSRGVYDPYSGGQSQNPAAYGGQAANASKYGTATDLGSYDDSYDAY